jgi:hypothetical protein
MRPLFTPAGCGNARRLPEKEQEKHPIRVVSGSHFPSTKPGIIC